MEGKVKGFIEGNKTYVTKPKFQDKHVSFMKLYLAKPDLKFEIKTDKTIIHDKFSVLQLENLVRAYIYEFGRWE